MGKKDAITMGIEIGPRAVRAVLLSNGEPVKNAQRGISNPSGAWPALAEIIREVKPPPKTKVSVTLLPPFVESRTMRDVGEKGKSMEALRLRLRREKADIDNYVISYVEQGGLHGGDLYYSLVRKDYLREIYRLASRARLRVERVEPWYQSIPRVWIAREPQLLQHPALFVDAHQGVLTYLGRSKGNVDLITYQEGYTPEDIIHGIDHSYLEVSKALGSDRGLAVLLSSDDSSLYTGVVPSLQESGYEFLYPEDAEQLVFGDFALAYGTALDISYAGLNGNFWNRGLEEELGGRKVPAAAVAPVLVALLLMALGATKIEGSKAELSRRLQAVEEEIATVKPDADRAAALKAELDKKKAFASVLKGTLFGNGRWTTRLSALFPLLARHGVAVSQVTLTTPNEGAPTITVAMASTNANGIFQALNELENTYPVVRPAPVSKKKLGGREVYTTTATLEVESGE